MAQCANPLFLAWVKEWWDEARMQNSKGASVYKKAYNSLKDFPVYLEHPSEAQKLQGFGPKLCDRLTAKLKAYCEEEGREMTQTPHRKRKKVASKNHDGESDDGDDSQPSPAKKPRKTKPYVPQLRSGAYALIRALGDLRGNSSQGLTKHELIDRAQPYCDASFTAPPQTMGHKSFFTAWNSMKTLEAKELVYSKGHPSKKYALTEDGWDVAKGIEKTLLNQGRLDDFRRPSPKCKGKERVSGFMDLSSSPQRSRLRPSESPTKPVVPDIVPQVASTAIPTFTPITLPPGTFTIELVLDIREILGKTNRDYMQTELEKKGIKPIMRALELGDCLWVAKLYNPDLLPREGAEGDEVLLDWIVERKRLDDLVSSIKDGRFHEQKFRLRKGGVKNVVYIIEEISVNEEFFTKYQEAVESAIASTQVVNGFFVKKTQKMDDTIRYLTRMTMMLKERYENRHLQVIPTSVITSKNYLPLLDNLRETQPGIDYHITYSTFASLVSKSDSLTLRDVYLKMLMCTKGVTGEKAVEMQKRWKTPAEFLEALEKCGSGEEGRKKRSARVCAEMGHLVGRKKIAKALSVKIAEVWGDEEYA